MDISADFLNVVVVLVAPVDRAFRPRYRLDVVDAGEESLAQTEVYSVLNLRRELLRLVDDALCLSSRIRTISCRLNRIEQVSPACIARVQEDLPKELIHSRAKLIRLIDPVLDLSGTQSSRLDSR